MNSTAQLATPLVPKISGFQARKAIIEDIQKFVADTKTPAGLADAYEKVCKQREIADTSIKSATDEGLAGSLDPEIQQSKTWDTSFPAVQSMLETIKSGRGEVDRKWLPIKAASPSSPNNDSLLGELSTQVTSLRQDIGKLQTVIPDLATSVDEVTKSAKEAAAGPRRAYAVATEKANNVTPKTLKQAQLKSDYNACVMPTRPREDPTAGGVVSPEELQRKKEEKARADEQYAQARRAAMAEKKQKAEALFAQVKEDNEQSDPPRDEGAYVKLRDQQAQHLKSVKDRLTDTGFDASYATYDNLNKAIEANTSPDRFTEALAALKNAITEAERCLGARASVMAQKIDEVLSVTGSSSADEETWSAAKKLAEDADPEVLRSLPAEQQAKLLKALRKGKTGMSGMTSAETKRLRDTPEADLGKLDPNQKEQRQLLRDMQRLQIKVYKATQLDKEFLQHEKQFRAEVINALTGDADAKGELKKARDNWPTMTDPERRTVLEKMIKVHCETIKFDPPNALNLNTDASSTSGGFQRREKQVNINKEGDTFKDFESAIDSIFHENSHNWQAQLIDKFNAKQIPATSPLYKQALLFAANSAERDDGSDDGYEDGDGYKVQPKEAHAHRAGPKFARALMRALAK